MPRRKRRELVLALLAVVALTASGCARAPQSGVKVKKEATELVFGVPPVSKPAGPPNSVPPEDPIGVVDTGGPFKTPRPTPGRGATPPPPPPDKCPPAARTAFAKDPATTDIRNRPLPGTYQFRVRGYQNVATLGTFRLPPFFERTIKDVKTTTGDDYTFTTVEPEIRFGSQTIVEQTYEVLKASISESRPAGIYLTKIVRRSGQDSNVFEPKPGVLILPTPVEIGKDNSVAEAEREKIDTVGVDPGNFMSMRITGSVLSRPVFDACGEPFQAWFVNALLDVIDADGTSYKSNFNYAITTQFGGAIVAQQVDTQCTTENNADTQKAHQAFGGAEAPFKERSDDERKKTCTPEATLSYDTLISNLRPE
ncbi:MAG TPA: hypothetical protein VNE62_09670 [Actinomycetota bacterium]|nr:hypothetical protein [Actinomycetota bacterium]